MEVTKVAEIEEKSAEAAVDSESVVAEDTEDVGPGQHLFGEPLEMYLLREPKLAVAFSGGCDSALLLAAAKLAGCEVRAYLVKTAFQPDFELDDARAVAAALDHMEFQEIVGSLAGDDTIACFCKSAEETMALMSKIRKLIHVYE